MKNTKTIFALAVVFGILLAPSFSSAQTAEQLQAQIQALLAQIQQLQNQLSQIQGQPAQWCHDFNRNLKIGDGGPEVGALKTALMKDGVMPYRAVTYDFDEETASYVVAFQQKYASEILSPLGLQYGTGVVGSATRAKLNSLFGCKSIPPTEILKTYSNGKYGFSFNYPGNWIITEKSDGSVSFSNIAAGHKIDVMVTEGRGFGYCYKFGPKKNIIVGGRTAETGDGVGLSEATPICENPQFVANLGMTYVSIPLNESKTTFLLIIYEYPLNEINLAKSNLNQILSSFRFIRPSLLKLISPAPGEILRPGSSYTIKWSATPDLISKYPYVDIILEGVVSGGCDPSGCGALPPKNVFARIWDAIMSVVK